ncbi:T9SS type A sorting domain-containing protein [Mangrovimonas futianensis]|uniref:T9SS type A sorting domain-containing protein n=1 Tax=Mangrovimonas futianensis TaxID=2895523 RepID=UPI001E5BB970|nr:T9SS type A sorting domain-containing protein [Mangrovimonas futianensis]MCF1422481.1 T9SS type A sorting domain-containing protein [Mangrovimonas futianensis]
MRNIILLVFVLFLCNMASSQSVEWEYINPNYLTQGKSITRNSQNQIISVGNGGPTTAYNEYINTQKLSPLGDLIWEESIATGLTNNYHSVTWVGTDSNDNIFVVGYRFTLSGSNQVPNAIKVLKYDNNGNLLNNTTVDGVFGSGANTNLGHRNKAEIDENGNLYVATTGTVDNITSGYVLLKFDNNANLLWSRTKNFSNVHLVRNMDYNNGRVVLTGKAAFSDFDNRLVAWDSSGNELWSTPTTGADQTWGTDVVMDSSGNTYALVQIYDVNDNLNVGLVKYNLSGNTVFVITYPLPNQDSTSGRLKMLPNGNLVISGTNWSVSGGGKLYVAEVLTSNGTIVSDGIYSLNQSNNWVYNVEVAPSGNYYVSGTSDNQGGAPAEMFLYAFSTTNGFEWSTTYNNEGVLPMGLVLDSNENVYAVMEINYTVVKFGNSITLSDDELFDSEYVFGFYPNPVKDVLNLKSNQDIFEVKIFNSSGQQVFKQKPLNKNINIGHLKQGFYIVQVMMNNGKIQTSKIFKI